MNCLLRKCEPLVYSETFEKGIMLCFFLIQIATRSLKPLKPVICLTISGSYFIVYLFLKRGFMPLFNKRCPKHGNKNGKAKLIAEDMLAEQ